MHVTYNGSTNKSKETLLHPKQALIAAPKEISLEAIQILSYQMNVAKISGCDKDLALWAAPARAQAVRQLGGPGLGLRPGLALSPSIATIQRYTLHTTQSWPLPSTIWTTNDKQLDCLKNLEKTNNMSLTVNSSVCLKICLYGRQCSSFFIFY